MGENRAITNMPHRDRQSGCATISGNMPARAFLGSIVLLPVLRTFDSTVRPNLFVVPRNTGPPRERAREIIGGRDQVLLREGRRNRLGNKTLAYSVVVEGFPLGAPSFIVYMAESAYRNNSRTSTRGLAGPGGHQLMAEYLEKKGPIHGGGANRETIQRFLKRLRSFC